MTDLSAEQIAAEIATHDRWASERNVSQRFITVRGWLARAAQAAEAEQALRRELDAQAKTILAVQHDRDLWQTQHQAAEKTILELQEWKESALLLMGNSIELMREMADRARAASVPSVSPHVTRMSDSSLYDEVCTKCGKTDRNGPIVGECAPSANPQGEPMLDRFKRLFGSDLTGKPEEYEFVKQASELYNWGWQVAHDPRDCGHPAACWQDRNYPASENSYNPETHTSDPPIDYRCVICEAEQSAELWHHQYSELHLDITQALGLDRTSPEFIGTDAMLKHIRKLAGVPSVSSEPIFHVGPSGHYAEHLSTHIKSPSECPTCLRIGQQVAQRAASVSHLGAALDSLPDAEPISVIPESPLEHFFASRFNADWTPEKENALLARGAIEVSPAPVSQPAAPPREDSSDSLREDIVRHCAQLDHPLLVHHCSCGAARKLDAAPAEARSISRRCENEQHTLCKIAPYCYCKCHKAEPAAPPPAQTEDKKMDRLERSKAELLEALEACLVDPMDLPHYGIAGACDPKCPRCKAQAAIAKARGGGE